MRFRYPKTINERRQYQNAFDHDYPEYIKVRGSRRPNRLYYAFDDYLFKVYRSWKHFRKTQWKVK